VTAGAIVALYDISRTLCATERFVSDIPITGKVFARLLLSARTLLYRFDMERSEICIVKI